jgi:hypothetical protein
MLLTLSAPAALHGTREEILGTEVVWQKPPGAAKGLLFLAHGCNHGAIDFWPQAAACAQCIGLPEEVRITKETLQAGWAVVAMSSTDRAGSRCWNIESDGPAVAGRHRLRHRLRHRFCHRLRHRHRYVLGRCAQ